MNKQLLNEINIYVASSWRNTYHELVVNSLAACDNDFKVYDFKKDGFGWRTIDAQWNNWTTDQYLAALLHPLAIKGFQRDMFHLKCADIVVYVTPCGVSASLELGYGVGAGKKTIVYLPEIKEPELMLSMADLLTNRIEDVIFKCNRFAEEIRKERFNHISPLS